MSALDLLREPVSQRLALALLHFVWQGALIALVLGGSMWLLRVRRPQVRYAVWLGGLALMAACPAVTFIVAEPSITVATPVDGGTGEATALPWPDAAGGLAAAPLPSGRTNRFHEQAARALERHDRLVALSAPYLVLFWLSGVGLFGGRLLLGFAGVHWLARGRQRPRPELAEQAALLAQRIGLRRVPSVAICTRAREALAVGLVRPLILLPAAWLTELPPEVLRAVLAHELAHVRRRDVWVNLLQRVVETVLFYHPAVWWVSRRVRAERELCCDDLAVKATGGRVEYAQALECVARRRLAESSPLLAAGIGGRKMALLKRVRHVLGTEPDGASRAGRWSAGLIALAIPPALWLVVSVLAPPVVGQEEDIRERERSESPEAREREPEERAERRQRDRGDRVRERDSGFLGPEFEEALRDAQRQAREAQARAEEARRRAEEMMRQMAQRRLERMRSEAEPGDDDTRERDTGRPGPEERRERMERFRRERADGFGPGGPPLPGLVEEIRRLREEVEQLRREVEELRQGPRRGPFGGEDGIPGMMRRMRETRDPFGVRPPSPPSPPDRPRMERDRERERDEEQERDRERHDEDVPARFRIRRPDRPLPPPGPPEAHRSRISRDERRDEDRQQEARDPAGDEARQADERDAPEAETAEAEGARLLVAVYPVADLAVTRDGEPDIDSLKQRVERVFRIGGEAPGMVVQDGAKLRLVVRTTDDGHAQVRQMLTSLRQQADQEQTGSEELPPPAAPSQDPPDAKD